MIHGHGDDLYKYDNVEINFSTNIYNHFDHSPLFKALAGKLPTITSYPEPAPERLEHAIAAQLGVGSNNVMAANGATEAIYLIALCFKEKRHHIVQPTFSEYADACRIYRCETEYITHINPTDGFGDNDAVWLCSPNNPTGQVTQHDPLASIIKNNPATLFIVDQSYSAYTTEKTLQCEEAVRLGNALILYSMTKDFGIPGLRLGYAVGNDTLVSKVKSYRMPWSVNSLAAEAGLFLAAHPDNYRINAAAICKERVRVAGQLEGIGIKTFPSDSNMLLCEMPAGNACELKEYLVARHGILIRDASNFHGLSPKHFRIAVQTEAEDNKLINALREWTKR